MLPKLAFTSFASRYREPKLAEGFAEITMIDFEVRDEPHVQKERHLHGLALAVDAVPLT